MEGQKQVRARTKEEEQDQAPAQLVMVTTWEVTGVVREVMVVREMMVVGED